MITLYVVGDMEDIGLLIKHEPGYFEIDGAGNRIEPRCGHITYNPALKEGETAQVLLEEDERAYHASSGGAAFGPYQLQAEETGNYRCPICQKSFKVK